MLNLKQFLSSLNDDECIFVINGTDLEDFRSTVRSKIENIDDSYEVTFTEMISHNDDQFIVDNGDGTKSIPHLSMVLLIKDFDDFFGKLAHFDAMYIVKVNDEPKFVLGIVYFEDKL